MYSEKVLLFMECIPKKCGFCLFLCLKRFTFVAVINFCEIGNLLIVYKMFENTYLYDKKIFGIDC